jgi:hypothetical protein
MFWAGVQRYGIEAARVLGVSAAPRSTNNGESDLSNHREDIE